MKKLIALALTGGLLALGTTLPAAAATKPSIAQVKKDSTKANGLSNGLSNGLANGL